MRYIHIYLKYLANLFSMQVLAMVATAIIHLHISSMAIRGPHSHNSLATAIRLPRSSTWVTICSIRMSLIWIRNRISSHRHLVVSALGTVLVARSGSSAISFMITCHSLLIVWQTLFQITLLQCAHTVQKGTETGSTRRAWSLCNAGGNLSWLC